MPNLSHATTTGMNVLVVDDQRMSREVLSEALRRFGCKIQQVANADEALSELRLRNYPLMFIDLMMPGMDGYALARQIRRIEKENKRQPSALIAYSASLYAENGIVVELEKSRLMESGFDDGLAKPITPQSLRCAMDAALVQEATPAGDTKPETPPAPTRKTDVAPAPRFDIRDIMLSPGYDLPNPVAFQRALIVDDDRFMLSTAEVQVQACLSHVHVARDAQEALKLFAEEPFDLILLDLEMPGMDGYTLAKVMRSFETGCRHRTCLVALSGNLSDAETLRKCAAHGMDDCMSKPFNAKLFRSRMELWQKGHYPAHKLAKK